MAEDPGGTRKTLAKRAKSSIAMQDSLARRESVEALPVEINAAIQQQSFFGITQLVSDVCPERCHRYPST